MEQAIAALEGGNHAVACACGMAAITQTLLPLLKSGDHVVCHRSVCDWTDWWLRDEMPRFGVETTQVDLRDAEAYAGALRPDTRIVYLEPLSNPGLDLIDLRTIVSTAHDAGALVVVDNTFLSPALLRPLEYGADIVLHSATKFLNGHGDALGGVAVMNDAELHSKVYRSRNLQGGVISPFNAFLIMRGMETLSMRMNQHGANAMKVARFLSGHSSVSEVRYPGLRSHPDGCGGMVGLTIKGGQSAGHQFAESLQLVRPWVSLGDTGSLVYGRQCELRKGIPEGFTRLSVGLEDAEDIIADLDQALNKAHPERQV
ncbi:MAG: aminotransferase class I/II-fold pyridoxal phosphate-dependent enzyme [Gemmatimonadetes bacterium]|jgi:methionine-gamma-lyase|nr:aminotransferase class I/II-fold pyridoxal phosphate-dependent enzyme [Gemmatimonadota bacterium]MBT7861878.1 aminotransferase class I/II-fold pyridoxal phosphate-dependent enzyme [Gemmatimonadota bacterium]